MWFPGFPPKRPIPPEPYGDYLARKMKEKAMDTFHNGGGASPVARVDVTVQTSAEELRLREHVKQLQGLLQRQKELTEQARQERDELRRRLNQISDIADQ